MQSMTTALARVGAKRSGLVSFTVHPGTNIRWLKSLQNSKLEPTEALHTMEHEHRLPLEHPEKKVEPLVRFSIKGTEMPEKLPYPKKKIYHMSSYTRVRPEILQKNRLKQNSRLASLNPTNQRVRNVSRNRYQQRATLENDQMLGEKSPLPLKFESRWSSLVDI